MPLTEFDAATGAANHTGSDTAAISPGFARITLDKLVASRTNPRVTFDQAKLQELADSIKGLGVMQPILVRPLPGSRVAETSTGLKRGQARPEYEIISGERRWRASQLAGVADIPAMIRALSDQQVLEAQLVENLQRDDLHPLEEAEGYQRLCEATGISKEQIGAKIGKSRSYVYGKLRLLTLGEESRKAFYDGQLDGSRAEMLATVADPKLQLKALKQFVEVDYHGKPMSVRQCAEWLQVNILLKLKDAPFDTKDDQLLATNCPPALLGTGACARCPKRTHADRDLFAGFDGPDMCTDPVCFHAKETAHLAVVKANAAAKGMEVVAGKEAKRLKPNSYVDRIKDHVRLQDKVATADGEVTVASLIKGTDLKPKLMLDPHDAKKTHKIVPAAAVEQLLKDRGLVKETPTERATQQKAAADRERVQLQIEEQARWRTIDALSERLRDGAITAFSAPMLRLLALALLDGDHNTYDRDHALARLWHLPQAEMERNPGWSQQVERSEALQRHVRAVHDEALGPMVLQILVASEAALTRFVDGRASSDTPAIDQLADEIGVDPKAILADVQAEFKERLSPQAGATLEAAPQASNATEDAGATAPARAASRRRKLSAEEAKSGIADAMQCVEDQPGDSETPAGPRLGDYVTIRDKVAKAKRQWRGKEGEVVAVNDDLVTVKVDGAAKPVTFNRADLEVME